MMLDFPEPLTDRYRPKRIRDLIGLAEPKRVLIAWLLNPYPAAWYFLGQSGVGKTIAALAIIDELQAEEHHISSKNCDFETIESTIAMCHRAPWNLFGPNAGKPCHFHVVHVSEADQMTLAAQVALLSKMDATAWPPQTIFIFTANSRKGMEDRFMSRCSVLEFTADSMEGELEEYLARIYKLERGKHPIDCAALCKASQYNVRDAVNKLQIELLLGTNRKGLPSKDLKIVPEHAHDCEKCHKPWKHAELKCKLPHTAVCPTCGGAANSRSAAAYKAHETMKKKAQAQLLEQLNQQKTRTEILGKPTIVKSKKGKTA